MPRTGSFTIPATHPSLPGHFPGRPLVPGVVLLEAVLALAPERYSGAPIRLERAKFTRPVLPGQAVEVTWADAPAGGAAFVCHVAGLEALRGRITSSAAE